MRTKLTHWFEIDDKSISLPHPKEKGNNDSCGQAQLPWRLITCATVFMLPASLHHLLPLTITRTKHSIYFHIFTSTDDQFSNADVLLSPKLSSPSYLKAEPKSCLCKKTHHHKQGMLHLYKPTRKGYNKVCLTHKLYSLKWQITRNLTTW